MGVLGGLWDQDINGRQVALQEMQNNAEKRAVSDGNKIGAIRVANCLDGGGTVLKGSLQQPKLAFRSNTG